MRPAYLLGLLLLACASGVQAQDPSSLTPQITAAQDPDQLYQLGLQALAAGQPELARQAFERVVTVRPEFAGAWLDLALATFKSGDAVAAVEHLEYLRSQFNLPPAVAAQVDTWQDLWQANPQASPPNPTAASPAANTASPGWVGELHLAAGHDTNANNGLARQQITLSLPTGNTLFDLDNAYRPRAAPFALANLTLGGPAWPLGAGRLRPLLLLRSKQLAQEGDYSTLELQPGLAYQRPAGGQGSGTWQAYLMAQHYRLGGQALFNGLRLSAQRHQPWQACHASATAELEERTHLRVPSLGGTLLGLGGGLWCRLPSSASLSASAKTTQDHPRQDRAGGSSRSTELHLRYEQALSPAQSLQMSWQHTRTTDQAGYSPLLQNNAARSLQRNTLSLGLRQAIAPAWEARLSLEHFVQHANLALFEQRGSLFMLGLAYRF